METQEYQVKAPDGQVIKLRGPAGASQDQVIAQAKKLYAGRQEQAPQPSSMLPDEPVQAEDPRAARAMAAMDQYPLGQPSQEEPGMLDKIGSMITGSDRETRATQELPELQNSGLLAGLDIPPAKRAGIIAALMTMTDPAEIAQALKSLSPDIGIQQDEKGNLIAANNATGARAVLNKPGASGMDALQATALGAAFAPTGRAASLVGGGIAKQAATLGATSAATQAAIEGGQALAGGEFNPDEVALAAGIGGAMPVAGAAIGAGVNAAKRVSGAVSDAVTDAASGSRIAQNIPDRGEAVPEADMLAAIKAQQEAGNTEGLVKAVTESATAKGGKKIPTLERLADEVMPDETILQAADRLGLKDQLIPSQYSRSQAYREVEQGLASIPGSQLNAQQKQAASSLAQKADDLIQKYGGDVDKAAVSQEFKSKGLSLIESLEMQSNDLYKRVGDAIRPSTKVSADNSVKMLREKAEDLGGPEYLGAIERRALKAMENAPTYGRLDLIRRQVGEGLRGRGPFKDAESGSLKRLYGSLSDDQQDAAKGLGAGELYSSAKQLVSSRKTIEDTMAAALGKDLTGAITSKTGAAIKSLGSGNYKDFDRIMATIPKDMQQRVVMTSLNDAFTAGSRAQKQLSAPGFVDWYEGLSRNKGAKARLDKYMPKEARDTLGDIFSVARGMREASKERITTGRIQALMDNFATDGGMLAKLYGIGKQVAVAEGAGSAVGFPGAGTVGILTKIMNTEKTPIIKAADDLLSSRQFKDAIRESAKKGTEEAGNAILRRAPAYQRWLKALAPDERTAVNKVGGLQWLGQGVSDKSDAKESK